MDALRLSYKKTGVVPPALAEQPVITPDLQFYLESFFFLSSFRGSSGFGPNPLAFSDVYRYAELIGYTSPEDFLPFAEMMRACDQVYLEVHRNEADSKPKPGGSSKTSLTRNRNRPVRPAPASPPRRRR